ncbi:MAG: hypothetical protein K0S28_40, partial [Paucimonas sp.]|nr:hypothetical protein [Paucimonas sp.]
MKRYLLFPLIATAPLYAADISVVGVFPGKAVLVIDDGPPKTYAAGQKITSDITLISVDGNSAVIMENGKRQTIPLGDNSRRTSNSDAASVILSSD